MKNKSSYINLATAVLLLCGGYFTLIANERLNPLSLRNSSEIISQVGRDKSKKIILEHADLLIYDAVTHRGIQRLIGDVVFKHDNATMYCDSAYLNDADQSLEAFGRVHMVQADTINIYAEYLHYNGITKLAKLRHNVRLESPSNTLYTDSLNYDRVEDVGYYFEGGSVVDEQNTLTSDYGEYFPKINEAIFRYNVKLVNDSTEMSTETLFYNTNHRVARFEGPTLIASDSSIINSRRGVYDLSNDVGILLDRSEVHSGHRVLIGDSIYYDGVAQHGEAFGEMELIDTLQKANLYGDYGYFESKRNYAFATSRARVIDYSQKDTLYIGADTLELISLRLPDSLYQVDTDSMFRELRAYRTVRIYRKDGQAIADSMVYRSQDSTLCLYGSPIMWADQRQSSGDTVKLLLEYGQLKYADVLGNMFSVERPTDTLEYYNQIMGERMRAHIEDSTLRKLEVFGEVESIFYMQDEATKVYKGINRLKSRDMTVEIDSGVLKKIHWQGEAHGKLYPMAMGQVSDVNRLPTFIWEQDKRPKTPEDVVSAVDTTLMDGGMLLLSKLKKFSGMRAALRAYEPILLADSVAEPSIIPKDEISASVGMDSNYIYVLRPSPKNSLENQSTNNDIDTTWVYNPFLSKESQDNSITNLSIGMPIRRHSISESSAFEPNSSLLEK